MKPACLVLMKRWAAKSPPKLNHSSKDLEEFWYRNLNPFPMWITCRCVFTQNCFQFIIILKTCSYYQTIYPLFCSMSTHHRLVRFSSNEYKADQQILNICAKSFLMQVLIPFFVFFLRKKNQTLEPGELFCLAGIISHSTARTQSYWLFWYA